MAQHVNPYNKKYDELTEEDKLLYHQGYIAALESAAQQLQHFATVPPPKDERWTQELGDNGEAAWLFDRAQRVRLGLEPNRYV